MNKTEFTYEYEKRNGHPVPKSTIAVVPILPPANSTFPFQVAIGWSWCSRKDNPNKSRGRSIAHARALGCMNAPAHTIRTPNGAIIGRMFSVNQNHNNIRQTLSEYFKNETIERILKTVNHLVEISK